MDIKRPISKQPIPDSARLVFKGKLFDVYQWDQELFDGKKITFEKLKRPDTVNIIPLTTKGEIVLCEQEQPGTVPFVGCLGGRLNEGEHPLEAAKRELLEETGMEAKQWILWDSSQPIDKIDWAIYTFIAKGCRKVREQNVDGGEKIKLKPVTFDEFLEITTQDNFRDTEVALKVFHTMNNPKQFEEMKKLFIA